MTRDEAIFEAYADAYMKAHPTFERPRISYYGGGWWRLTTFHDQATPYTTKVRINHLPLMTERLRPLQRT